MEKQKYVKVVFGTTPGANSNYTYKINEVNVATNWNPPKSLPDLEDLIFLWN